jgi:beta-lactamase superfamily II metal-dependent hydrolase
MVQILSAWPLLWYLIHAVIWCSTHTYAYLTVTNMSNGLAWGYYGIVALLASFIFYKWPSLYQTHQGQAVQPLMSRRTWRLLQLSAALLVLLATGATALAARPDGRLTITFLNVGPAGQGAQGEAILLHTPDGKNALIDGGSDATSLGQELDSRLPSWQHSLDAVILTSTMADHLAGLQDVVSRYQVSAVMDAGMLHPNAAYGLWRRTIAERNLPYTQIRQGTTIAIGTQVALQVLWPQSPLHKGSNEQADNGLIIRLISPGLSMLLLGTAVFSTYALRGLPATITSDYLRADIVQVVAEVGKRLPAALSTILQLIRPSQVIVTPATLTNRQRKAGLTTAILDPLPPELVDSSWQTVQTAQVGTLEITTGNQGWLLNVYNV